MKNGAEHLPPTILMIIAVRCYLGSQMVIEINQHTKMVAGKLY